MARAMKDSGIEWIGEIPVGWKVDNIKRHFSVIAGATPKSENREFWDGDIPWITPADYKTRDKFISGGKRNITQAGYDSCGTTLIPRGSIVFSKRAPVGTVAIANNELCTNQGCLSCVVKDGSVPDYYYYAMSAFTEQFELLSTGTTFKEIAADVFANFRLPAPSIAEQQNIADFLDTECARIDAVIEQTRASIEEYKKLKQSVITQAVTKGIRPGRKMKDSGVEWVRELPEEWAVIPSKYLFRDSDVRRQDGDEQMTASQQFGIISQTKYIELTGAKVVFANKRLEDWKHIEPYDFIISLRSFQGGLEMSETTGCITWHYIVLKPCKSIYSYYFKWLFKSDLYIKALQRTCNFIRDGQDLRYSNFIQVPLFEPSLKEQKEIADYLNKKCAEIDTLISKKESFVADLESYKKSLIFEYVTGKKEAPYQQETLSISFVDMRALLMCRIIELMKPKGRIHLLKALYSIDCLSGLNHQTQYIRYTHGPYDTRIGEYETALAKHGWISSNRGAAVEYKRGKNFSEYRELYQRYYHDLDTLVKKICTFLKPMKTSQAERVATLLAVWNDFLLDGEKPTDEEIIQEVRSRWTPNKAHSAESTWRDTLNKIKENHFIPKGMGKHTIPKVEE